MSEGCSTPATPRTQGANRRSRGEALRQGPTGELPRNVGWSRAWTLSTGEPIQDLSARLASSADGRVTIDLQEGGMRASSGIVIPAMGDTSDEMLIAIACVAVGYPAESPQQSKLDSESLGLA